MPCAFCVPAARLHGSVISGTRSDVISGAGSHQHGLHKSESYRGQTQAWWSVDEHMKPRGVLMSSHQQMGMSLAARIFQQVSLIATNSFHMQLLATHLIIAVLLET